MTPAAPPAADAADAHRASIPALTLAALGVVFGDIGTSPLYALKEGMSPGHGIPITEASVFGVLSLIVWTLTLVVSVKYAIIVMRADNHGEGGMLSIMSLASKGLPQDSRRRLAVITLCLVGASLFYGDSVVTPAISVISAVEGLEVISPALHPYVVPIALGILFLLFFAQKLGTGLVGRFFGPVTILWFGSLALVGIYQIARNPGVLAALSPTYAIGFIVSDPVKSFILLGSVFLAVTGVEALYADMGHFGKKPIRLAWFIAVFPALVLNYFGQGALLIADPAAVQNPFFLAVPAWARIPMILLATAATVIASQATISGAFSLTAQAMKLGYTPRMRVTYTSATEKGQVYVPFINWALFVFVVILVLVFRTSSNMAAAYGIAVAGTMVVTSIMVCIVAVRVWRWPPWAYVPMMVVLLMVDTGFLSSNLLKIPDGGWFPAVLGVCIYLLLVTWKQGRALVARRLAEDALPLVPFIESIAISPPHRAMGTAVFMTTTPNILPHALLHNLKHNQVLHEQVVLLTIRTEEVPRVPESRRVDVELLDAGFVQVIAHMGYQENADIEALLKRCEMRGLHVEPMLTSYFLSRENVIPTDLAGMALWREHLFVWMYKNGARASDFFRIPANRVVELGTQVEI
ncbi:MAG: potassium transporter Kup [Burkholderiales bacterium]|nr:potassium transporter Kup [Burkholderiales bacterium]